MKDTQLLGGLDLLQAIVQTGSFVRAGERVGLSQSGVSRAVQRLEQRIGVRLFDRNARAVALTDEGRRFHEQVAPLVGALEDAVDAAAGAAGRVRGKLRINVDAYFARDVLAPKIGRFLSTYPEVALDVVVTDHTGNLVADGFDAAVRFGEPTATGVIARKLVEIGIVTCAAPSYLARHGRPREPGDLARGHECILFIDPATGRPFEWEFHRGRRRQRVEVAGRLVVNDVATAIGACAAGLGIAQLMAINSRELVASGELVELFPSWQDERFPLYVLHPSRHLPPAKVRAFVDFVAAETRRVSAGRS